MSAESFFCDDFNGPLGIAAMATRFTTAELRFLFSIYLQRYKLAKRWLAGSDAPPNLVDWTLWIDTPPLRLRYSIISFAVESIERHLKVMIPSSENPVIPADFKKEYNKPLVELAFNLVESRMDPVIEHCIENGWCGDYFQHTTYAFQFHVARMMYRNLGIYPAMVLYKLQSSNGGKLVLCPGGRTTEYYYKMMGKGCLSVAAVLNQEVNEDVYVNPPHWFGRRSLEAESTIQVDPMGKVFPPFPPMVSFVSSMIPMHYYDAISLASSVMGRHHTREVMKDHLIDDLVSIVCEYYTGPRDGYCGLYLHQLMKQKQASRQRI